MGYIVKQGFAALFRDSAVCDFICEDCLPSRFELIKVDWYCQTKDR